MEVNSTENDCDLNDFYLGLEPKDETISTILILAHEKNMNN